MDRADRCRHAARELLADVEPPHLHDVITNTLDDASMVPGVFTLESAAAVDPTADIDELVRHAAGVQLIYDGLRLTRTLAQDEPWIRGCDSLDADESTPSYSSGDQREGADVVSNGGENADRWLTDGNGTRIADGTTPTEFASSEGCSTGDEFEATDGMKSAPPAVTDGNGTNTDLADRHATDAVPGDLEILAADILVARGFSTLAHTDAAPTAVQTVRNFGRDQTLGKTKGDGRSSLDTNLERDVLELATITGTAAVGGTPSTHLRSSANDIASTYGPNLPPATDCLDSLTDGSDPVHDDQSTTDRATSASDP